MSNDDEVAVQDDESAVQEENSLVAECWNLVLMHSNRILYQAGIYDLYSMEIPNPNIRDLLQLLKLGVMPVLRQLGEPGALNPLNGVKISTMEQTIQCIHDITVALDEENQVNFAAAVNDLKKQPLIN